jgi:SAM-dependent methyltransferase
LTKPREAAVDGAAAGLEFAVLRDPGQIEDADAELRRRGLLEPRVTDSAVQRVIRWLLRRPQPQVVLKTWDVLRSIDAITSLLEPMDPILDVGCFACDVLPALKRLGYRNLTGIDLNPAVVNMPFAETIRYTVGDLLATPWRDDSFLAITAISVIEHGVPDEDLCREVSRLLRPGGAFIFTTDYWPQKIATTEKWFGLDWRIFDAEEVERLVAVAGTYNLRPVAETSAVLRGASDPPVHFEGRDYTFLYGAFIRGED